ncbi:MAG TPA: WD40 repeat domain-containing protein [Verrucomicrobiota bacterium]|nr:WD40 repeat domain-containing protein [Verrucomicrobiota bacterium]HNU50455.1 WD40 repeat domain-containing protein [Verrucomicrobiota bacterium]
MKTKIPHIEIARPAAFAGSVPRTWCQAVAFVVAFSWALCAQDTATQWLRQCGLGSLEGGAYSKDGQFVVTAGSRGAHLWRAADGELLRTFAAQDRPIDAIAISPDATLVVTGSGDWSGKDKTAKLWQVQDGSLVRTFTGHSGMVLSVAFSADGARLLTGSGIGSNTAREWQVGDGALRSTLPGDTGPTQGCGMAFVDFSPDRSLGLVGSRDGSVNLWRLSDATLVQRFAGHSDQVWALAYSPDGSSIATAHVNGAVRLWRASDGRWLRDCAGHKNAAQAIAFSPDGTILVSGDCSSIKLWRVSDASLLRTLEGGAYSMAVSPDGRYLVSAYMSVNLWDIGDGSLVRSTWPMGGSASAVAFSPDGTLALVGLTGGSAMLWRIGNGDWAGAFAAGGSVLSVAFSPDGTQAITGSDNNLAKVWRVSDRSLVHTLTGHAGRVAAVAFSPDGSLVLTGAGANYGGDYTAKVWRVSDGSLLRTLAGHSDGLFSAGFSPDGAVAATGSRDGAVLLWDVSDLVPKPPPSLAVEIVERKVRVSWTGGGVLQSAEALGVQFTPIEGVSSPYVTEAVQKRFFRVVR